MKRNLLLMLSLLGVLSCSKSEISQGDSLLCSASIDKSVSTKGLEVFSEDLNKTNNVFVLDAWLELSNAQKVDPTLANNPHYLDGKDMKYSSDGYWKGDGCNWRNCVKTNFWAVYPKSATGREDLVWEGAKAVDVTVDGQKKPSFLYDMTSFSGSRKDALDASPDLLAAYASGYWDEDEQSGGVLKLDFKHTLSGIRFRTGHIDSGYNIVEVKISNLHLKGKCTLTGSTSGGSDNLDIKWDVTDTPTSSSSLSQTVDATSVAEGSLMTGKKMMFVIPQGMTDDTTLSAVIKTTSDGSMETREVPLSGYDWLPGKIYDYSLSFYKVKDELEVSVNVYSTSEGSWTN